MSLLRPLFVASALAGAALWAPSAQALVTLFDVQTSSASAFTITGNNTVNNTLSFSRFDPSAIPASLHRKNIKLLGYDYILKNVTAGGAVTLINGPSSPAISGPFNSQVRLNFGRLDNNLFVAFDPVAATSNGTLPPGLSSTNLPLVATASNLVSPEPFIAIPPANTSSYEAPPATPLPSLTKYSASWSYISPPIGGSNYPNATIGGQVAVRWHYSFEVPGPLPIAGAGAAFAWSRRLRRRVGTLA